jgi:exonuclease III
MYHNSSSNKRGVAVLFRNSLNHEVIESAVDPQENALLLKVRINNTEFILGAIYGPNDNNCEEFFEFLRQKLTLWKDITVIIGGDWNATPTSAPLAENLDVIFMRDIPSRIRSEHVENLVNDFDLSDPFRILNPDSREFTYHPSGTVRKNSLSSQLSYLS